MFFFCLVVVMPLCASVYSSADPEGGGGQGVRIPLENHKLYGFL